MSANNNINEEDMEDDPMCDTDSSSDDDSDERHPDAYTGDEEVEVNFEARAPVDPHCHGISQLLSRPFLRAHINTMEMADLIIAQNYVGSVFAQCESDGVDSETEEEMCEDGTIFGVTTVINLTAKKDKPCVEQFLTFVLQKAENHATDAVLAHFRDVLSNPDRHVGFLINERFINIPAKISVPLLESLYQELKAATQKGMKYNFSYFIMIIKLFRKQARKGKPAVDFYTNAEEEVISEKALSTFEYSLAKESDMGVAGDWLESDPLLTPLRKVLLFDAKELPNIIEDIKKFIAAE